VTRSDGSRMTCRSIGRHIKYYSAAHHYLLTFRSLILFGLFKLPTSARFHTHVTFAAVRINDFPLVLVLLISCLFCSFHRNTLL